MWSLLELLLIMRFLDPRIWAFSDYVIRSLNANKPFDQFTIEQIAGDLVEVNVMIPPGASPATYEPTVLQLQNLKNSLAYMRIGHIGFELAWMDKIQSVNKDIIQAQNEIKKPVCKLKLEV